MLVCIFSVLVDVNRLSTITAPSGTDRRKSSQVPSSLLSQTATYGATMIGVVGLLVSADVCVLIWV